MINEQIYRGSLYGSGQMVTPSLIRMASSATVDVMAAGNRRLVKRIKKTGAGMAKITPVSTQLDPEKLTTAQLIAACRVENRGSPAGLTAVPMPLVESV